MSEKIIALCYDFDKTLSPDDMQAQGFIQSVGYNTKDFWRESACLARENEMDSNLAYMYMMVDKAKGRFDLTKKTLHDFGAKIKLYEGVTEWFDRINSYGRSRGIKIEHYIISSGLKEMIEGTPVAEKFTAVFASSFYFDCNGIPVWPAMAVNYTNKTQFLFRISKGVLNVYDDKVNECFDSYRIPFENIVYIGDSATDIPCMKLTVKYGGSALGVYDPSVNDLSKVEKLFAEGRIGFFARADYTEGSPLDLKIKSIIYSKRENP